METVPASFFPTQVYVPVSANVALLIFTMDRNSLPENLEISIPEDSVLLSLSHVMTGVGIPLISHSTLRVSPTIVFCVELKFVMNGSAAEGWGAGLVCVCVCVCVLPISYWLTTKY